MTTLLPDVETMMGDLLADVTTYPSMPKMLASKVPCRVVYKSAGTAQLPGFLDAPHVQVISLATTRDAAKALAETARDALYQAWRSQHRGAHGVFHKVVEVLSPLENRSGTVDGVFRFDATYEIQTRP